MEEIIYLDYAATSFRKPECVYQAMEKAGRELAVNAGRGTYRLAQKAVELIEETRAGIRRIAGAEDEAGVVFTPSATIACNQVLAGLEWTGKEIVYVTPFEHNAVMRVLFLLQKNYGFSIEELPIEPETLRIDMEKIKYCFLKRPPSVLVMTHVSNVTGYVIPWKEIAKLAQKYRPEVVIDGSQALGLIPVSLQDSGADYYIFAGHKTLYGPLGVGGYLNCRGKRLNPVIAGGTGSDSLNLAMPEEAPAGYEPGSPNIVAIAGLHAAVEAIRYQFHPKELWREEQEKIRYLREELQKIREVVLYPEDTAGKPMPGNEEYMIQNPEVVLDAQTGILAFNVEGIRSGEAGMLLDEDYHIAVRTGYHCAPLIHKYLKDDSYAGVVRASIGRFTTREELDRLVGAVREIARG